MVYGMFDVVLYHKHCFDGFAGMVVALKSGRVSKSAVVYGDQPTAERAPAEAKGRHVLAVDLGYKEAVLRELIEVTKSITFIDHHVTVRAYAHALPWRAQDRVVYDEKKSGCLLAWQTLMPHKKVPLFIKLVSDNDTGTWAHRDSKALVNALEVKYPTHERKESIKRWAALFADARVKPLVELGRMYDEYKQHITGDTGRKALVCGFPGDGVYRAFSSAFERAGQYRVAALNGTACPSITVQAAHLLDTLECDFVIIWSVNLHAGKYVFSMRSRSVDVGKLAFAFGGGGHRYAASFALPVADFTVDQLFRPWATAKRT